MAKYNQNTVQLICSLIENNSYSIAEICSKSGISERSFYNWQKKNAEFAELLKGARERFNEKMVCEAKRSLLKLVRGFYYEETRVIRVPGNDGQGKIKEIVTATRYQSPSLPAIIFTLCNLDPANWSNRLRSEVTGKNGKDIFPPARILTMREGQEIDLKSLKDDELNRRIIRIELKANQDQEAAPGTIGDYESCQNLSKNDL